VLNRCESTCVDIPRKKRACKGDHPPLVPGALQGVNANGSVSPPGSPQHEHSSECYLENLEPKTMASPRLTSLCPPEFPTTPSQSCSSGNGNGELDFIYKGLGSSIDVATEDLSPGFLWRANGESTEVDFALGDLFPSKKSANVIVVGGKQLLEECGPSPSSTAPLTSNPTTSNNKESEIVAEEDSWSLLETGGNSSPVSTPPIISASSSSSSLLNAIDNGSDDEMPANITRGELNGILQEVASLRQGNTNLETRLKNVTEELADMKHKTQQMYLILANWNGSAPSGSSPSSSATTTFPGGCNSNFGAL